MGSDDIQFAVDIVRHGSVVCLHVVGDVDLATVRHLEHEMHRCLSEQPAAVVVDMTRVGFCGSEGLAVLGFAQDGSAATVVALAPSPTVEKALQRTGMAGVIATFASVDAAITALQPNRAGDERTQRDGRHSTG
jgi:anti-anti-sigma factor